MMLHSYRLVSWLSTLFFLIFFFFFLTLSEVKREGSSLILVVLSPKGDKLFLLYRHIGGIETSILREFPFHLKIRLSFCQLSWIDFFSFA